MTKRTPQGQQHESSARDGGERGGAHGGNDFTVAHPAGHESWGATGPTAYGYGESVGGPVRGGLHDSARFDAAEGSTAYPEDMLSEDTLEDTLEPIDTSALRDEGAARPRTVLSMLAGIGIGAAVMYFLDPDKGARRRALVRDQAARLLRSGRREMHVVIEDARNRGTGAVAEVRGVTQVESQLQVAAPLTNTEAAG